MSKTSGQSRAPRIAIRQEAVLVTSDLTEIPVLVLDVSDGGFRIEALETFYIGETILIDEQVIIRLAREGDLAARIRWASGREAGGVFTEPSRLS